jgi:hypothetical protein
LPLHQQLEIGLGIDTPVVHLDPPCVDRVLEHAVPGLRRDTLAAFDEDPVDRPALLVAESDTGL